MASRFARARFMAGLILRVALRAIPQRAIPRRKAAAENPEVLIEALMIGDLAALDAQGLAFATARDAQGNPWFFIALESGSASAVDWFLRHGASPTTADRAGRLPLETLIQRAALADEMDDHLADCPAMARALIAQGASPQARTLTGAVLSDLARDAGLALA